MSFFNSLSIRIPLALVGGILYGLFTYQIVVFLNLSSQFAIFGGGFVFLFYAGSRFLILFSGIDSPYYSRGRKMILKQPVEINAFYQTTQWVGRFYHYHDMALFGFLVILSITFLISSVVDLSESRSMGNTFKNLLNALISFP